ncbi:MAG: DDE-type integrase/transposase/recombinase [Paracoccaceae bacterium]
MATCGAEVRRVVLCQLSSHSSAVVFQQRYPMCGTDVSAVSAFYQDTADLLAERGVYADRSTVFRWVQGFGPDLSKRTEKHLYRANLSWRVDKTYIRVGGKWRHLWRPIDANGQPVDFRLTARRDTRVAKAFFNKAIKR